MAGMLRGRNWAWAAVAALLVFASALAEVGDRPSPDGKAPAVDRTAPANPLTGTPQRTDPLTRSAGIPARPASAEATNESWWDDLTRAMRNLQREASRRIARQMAEIAEGKSPAALFVGMALAFLYGILHTLGPGHGKTIAASYFLAHDARFSRGAWMGVKIAVTHVIAAIALVWLADVTFRKLMGGQPAEVRVLQQVSYVAIVAVGAWMLWRSVRRLKSGSSASCVHDHVHSDACGHGHGAAEDRPSRRQQTLLAFAAGLAPCTGALLIMLYALANGIVLAGIILVACISLGMAVTIAGIGAFCIVARRAALRALRAQSPGRRWLGAGIEVAGALAIVALGALLLVTVPPAA